MTVHAGLVALHDGRRWRGVLLEGPSGVSKSDLAIRCLAAGWRLVADDRVILWTSGGSLYGRAPEALAGLIEHRGQAIRGAEALRHARIELIAACGGAEDRIPESQTLEREGVTVPAIALRPLDASAPARLTATLLASPASGAPLASFRR